MQRNPKTISDNGLFVLLLLLLNAVLLAQYSVSGGTLPKVMWVSLPLLVIALIVHRKKAS